MSILDNFLNPSHYEDKGVTPCRFYTRSMSFATGNAFKYLYRFGAKEGNTIEMDVGKALWYVKAELAECEVYCERYPEKIDTVLHSTRMMEIPSFDAIVSHEDSVIGNAMLELVLGENKPMRSATASLLVVSDILTRWLNDRES